MPRRSRTKPFSISLAAFAAALLLAANVSIAARGGGRGTGGNTGGNTGGGKKEPPTVNVPDVDNKTAQQAQQDAATARADRRKAEDNLASVVARLRDEFEKSAEMVQAQADLKASQADYETTAKPALAKVHETAEYKAAKMAKGQDEATISELQGQTDKGAQISTLAQDAMKQGAAETKLENDVLALDPAALGSKARIAAAGTVIGKLRAKFNATLPQSADWLAAKKSLDDAVQKSQSAEGTMRQENSKLASAQAAHDAAQAQKDKLAREYANQSGKKTTPPAQPPADPANN